jgi:hypothetical protein
VCTLARLSVGGHGCLRRRPPTANRRNSRPVPCQRLSEKSWPLHRTVAGKEAMGSGLGIAVPRLCGGHIRPRAP